MSKVRLTSDDALLIVDVQNDFLPGGKLAVPSGDEVIPVLNHYVQLFSRRGLPVFATRDWHPENHCSFRQQGGPWPPHCIAGTNGAQLAATLMLPEDTSVISKATSPERDAYSGFDGTDLVARLQAIGVKRIFAGGLATDYCVLNTVLDALRHRFKVMLMVDAIRAVNVRPEDGHMAIEKMLDGGAQAVTLSDLEDS